MIKIHRKKFNTKQELFQELNGWNFFRTYYSHIPNILSVDMDVYEIGFRDIHRKNNVVLSERLENNDAHFPIDSLLISLANIVNENAKISKEINGGTNKFYYSRLNMVNSDRLDKMYEKYVSDNPVILINNIKITNNPHLIIDAGLVFEKHRESITVPSQGDFHERNIFTDGSLVDFEAAGWNRLSTDIATFVHHTLFGGNYFGLKYGKWSNSSTRKRATSVEIGGDSININIKATRKKLAKLYQKNFLSLIDRKILNSIQQEIIDMLVLRLLSVFNVEDMEDRDVTLIFALINVVKSQSSVGDLMEVFLR